MFDFRKAKAKMEFGDYTEAKKIAKLAHSEHPSDQGIGKLLSDIARYVYLIHFSHVSTMFIYVNRLHAR